MRIAYDTAVLPPSSRMRVFRELVAETLQCGDPNTGVEVAFPDADFTARFDGRMIDETGTGISTSTMSRHAVSRSAGLARRATEEILLIGFIYDTPMSGTQDGRSGTLEAGDVAFVMPSRPYDAAAGNNGRQVYVRVHKQALTTRFGAIDDLMMTVFSAKLPAQRLVARFFTDLAKLFDEFDDVLAERMVGQGLDLLALAMSEQIGSSLANTTTHRSALLFRVRSFILSRLRDPDLSLGEVASAFGVSPRYINTLLSTERTSFGRFVLGARLAGCHRELVDPARGHRGISDIAFSWGFNNAAHFSRTFKARFDISPRDCRHTAFVARTAA